MTREDPIVSLSKVSEKGMVQIPHDVRQRMRLEPGTKMIIMVENDLIVLRKADFVFERKEPSSLFDRLRSVFTKLPIKDIEE